MNLTSTIVGFKIPEGKIERISYVVRQTKPRAAKHMVKDILAITFYVKIALYAMSIIAQPPTHPHE